MTLRRLLSGFVICLSLSIVAKAPVYHNEKFTLSPPSVIRTCCSFGADLSLGGIPFLKRTDITSISEIGLHHYLGDKEENNGNIYTRRGGFIDMGHLRDCADMTAFMYKLIISQKETDGVFTADLGTEGGPKTLTLNIPCNIDSLEAYQVAGKIAYDLSLWHEIATWFGTSYLPFVPERYSSFSPEDLYSNLLGVKLGISALKSDLDYDEAMTFLIHDVLDSLETVSTFDETYAAMEKVENIWWTKDKNLPSRKVLLKRYFDTDSCLSPWLIPSMHDVSPIVLVKPTSSLTNRYQLSIKLNYKFPLRAIFSSPIDRLITQKDFHRFVEYIEDDVDKLALKMEIKAERQEKRDLRKQNQALGAITG